MLQQELPTLYFFICMTPRDTWGDEKIDFMMGFLPSWAKEYRQEEASRALDEAWCVYISGQRKPSCHATFRLES